MAPIDDLREIPAGAYFVGDNNTVLELLDVPTDGPLFRVHSLDDERQGNHAQFPTDEFRNGDYPRLEIEQLDREIEVATEMSGTDHRYRLGYDDRDVAWPERLEQGGETYRIHTDEVPVFVEILLVRELGLDLVER